MSARILLADDDSSLRLVLSQALAREGYAVRATASLSTLAKMVRDGEGDLVISDVYMGDDCLFDVLPGLRAQRPELPVIVMSGQSTVLTAISAAGAGAYDYVPKPFDLDDLLEAVRRALTRGPEAKTRALAAAAEREERLPLIGRSAAMQDVYRIMARSAGTDMSVLIEGETGTGKEAAARAIHQFSKRKAGPFVRLSLAGAAGAAATEALFDAKGDAVQAVNGTLFIDDVDALTPDGQTALERFLDRRSEDHAGDARILCASSQPLGALALEGAFRPDLYYRLAIVTIRIPPLRERLEDVGDLARAFLVRAKREGLPEKCIDGSAIELLKTHSWPGNVRELENLLRRVAALRPEALITAREIVGELSAARVDAHPVGGSQETIEDLLKPRLAALLANAGPEANVYDQAVAAVERPLIELALQATRGNQIKAAGILGINRNTLRKKLQALGIRAGAGD
ncbi:MAG: sigma-54-dependent Fis family transcriptional regulator [Hyphomonadaceae bacterium]|nr:MAG: two-component system NtrC family nitrogen regulation response regulator GlnG [Caulobacteraceae bacterium]MBT9445111.1 sigma-54-dependent Fis family transcriptional regulator [Hyphomonadaceae bacterium]TPW08434.1 MAG: two-component system, NtrC family, nitrogen regulation response regulator GlnG [Alphaproteobacteria bacterium]